MAGDIGYSNEHFSRAVSYLALGEGSYRDRLQRALTEAFHLADYENPRPIPDELSELMKAFFSHLDRVDDLSDEDARSLGVALLVLASDIDYETRRQDIERSAMRFRDD
jgi:hypothetical protein